MSKVSIRSYLDLFCIISLTLAACSQKFGSLKEEQFDILKQSVSQILGNGYEVKKVDIGNEGYTNDNKDEYVVDFTFSLNKPTLLLPSTNLPGKLIFSKDPTGEWKCTFNSGNPSELFNFLQ
jgi:hypothetical protein